MNLIIISGIPCSGKTAISKIVSQHFNYDLISKDMYKENLFLRHGFNSIEEKQKLDLIAEDTLYREIEKYIELNKDVVIDKWLQGVDALKTIRNINCANLIFIRLITEPLKATMRYNQRNKDGSRPLCFIVRNQFPIKNESNVILENAMTVGEMKEKANRHFFKVGIKNLLEIDTSDIETEANNICKKIIDFIGVNLV